MDAAQSWRFQPARGNGKARKASATFTLECGRKAPPQPPGTYRAGGGVTAPSLISKIEPEYTEEARKAKYQGRVLLILEVDPSGTATNIRVFHMLGFGLDAKAMEAVKQWRFNPGIKDGKAVTVQAQIEVNFRLL